MEILLILGKRKREGMGAREPTFFLMLKQL